MGLRRINASHIIEYLFRPKKQKYMIEYLVTMANQIKYSLSNRIFHFINANGGERRIGVSLQRACYILS